jgi:hypothetical protein
MILAVPSQGVEEKLAFNGRPYKHAKHVVRFAVYDLSRRQKVQLTPRHEKTLAELALNLNAIEKE